MTDGILLVEQKDQVGTLIFNRPEKRNSLSPALLIEFHEALETFAKDNAIRAVVVRGVGEVSFSSGYDIGAIPTTVDPKVQRKLDAQNPLDLALESIINYPFPVIAMLNGYAFGAGCELAITCDMRVAADDIRMGMPPAKLGLVYSADGLKRFINTIGLPATKELFFTGRFYDANRVKELGMVDYMMPQSELEDFTYALAMEMAGNAPLALSGTKKVLNLLLRSDQLSDADRSKATETIAEAFASDDLKEGQRSFMEKRKPVFKGK
ncbi:MAG: enoyl-CoA hydratase-related protein [Desulfobacterales bacterium]